MPAYRDIIVFDFETLGKEVNDALNTDKCIVASVAAKAYNGKTLEPHPNGEFYSLCHLPKDEEIYEPGLDFIKLTREELADAPHTKDVWNNFVQFVNKYNWNQKEFFAPIAAGQNINRFDVPIAKRLTKELCPKKEKTMLFSDFQTIDLLDLTFYWWGRLPKTPKRNLKAVLEYCKVPYDENELHNAYFDVKYTGIMIMKFLKLHEQYATKIQWTGGRK